MKNRSGYRWFVVAVFFFFMLLHQADKLLIGPLTTPIMRDFGINKTQMGLVSTGALIIGAIMYPLWGFLYDRYSRAKLLALASFIWGSTTWLSAIAPRYPSFLITRASTGIDDSSYPGIYSLVTDYFAPKVRGKIYGLLELTAPIGYLLGMVLALLLSGTIGWRGIFYITGSLGIVLSVVILIGVRDPVRGQSEPELADLEHIRIYQFSWETARDLFKIRSLRILFIQGFFGVFPWNVITFWFFHYLETERSYSENEVFITMVFAVLVLAVGYPLGGALGDYFFKKSPRGRALVAMTGVLAGAVFFTITLMVPTEQKTVFLGMLATTALFIPMAAPNVISTVYDVTLPEVRSTALSIQSLIESSGAALSPLVAGWIADRSSLQTSFLVICVFTWLLCGLFFAIVAHLVPDDYRALRSKMAERARQGQALAH